MSEVIFYRGELPDHLKNTDCVEYLLGHDRVMDAKRKLREGGAYDRIQTTDPLQDGDIVIVGFGPNDTHMGKVQDGKIVGKENRGGDVTAVTIEEYHNLNYAIKIFRRNHMSLTNANNPFVVDAN